MMAAVFQISKKRKAPAKPSVDKKFKIEEVSEPEMGLIHGQTPGSMLEWRIACALWALRMDFDYQVSIFGGSRVRGGYVIDFMVYSGVLPTPVLAHGDYWHRSEQRTRDALMINAIQKYYRGQCNEPLVVWEHQAQTIPAAKSLLQEKLQ